MRTRWMLAILLAAAAPGPAAFAQPADTGIPTETQERLRGGVDDVDWLNLIGLVGLFGLLGLKREHSDDSYHPAPVE